MAAKKPKPAADVPAEAAAEIKHKFYIIAESRQAADNSAVIDWGWPRVKGGWTDPNGNKVTYIPDAAELRKIDNAWIYPGYRWYASISPHHFEAMVKNRAVKMLDEPPRIPFVEPKA